MQIHTKVYLNYFGFHNPDFIGCEICHNQAIDIHHIKRRSEFGTKTKDEQDVIENLIALCRKCHDMAHAGYFTKEYLTEIHLKTMKMYKTE